MSSPPQQRTRAGRNAAADGDAAADNDGLRGRLGGLLARAASRTGEGAERLRDAARDMRKPLLLHQALAAQERGNLEAAFWLLEEEFRDHPENRDVADAFWNAATALDRAAAAASAGSWLVEHHAAATETQLAAQYFAELKRAVPDTVVTAPAVVRMLPALRERVDGADDEGRPEAEALLRAAFHQALDERAAPSPGMAFRLFKEAQEIEPEAARRAAEIALASPDLHETKREQLRRWLSGERAELASEPQPQPAPQPLRSTAPSSGAEAPSAENDAPTPEAATPEASAADLEAEPVGLDTEPPPAMPEPPPLDAQVTQHDGDAERPTEAASGDDPIDTLLDPDEPLLEPELALMDPDSALIDPDMTLMDPEVSPLDPDDPAFDVDVPEVPPMDPDLAEMDPDPSQVDSDVPATNPNLASDVDQDEFLIDAEPLLEPMSDEQVAQAAQRLPAPGPPTPAEEMVALLDHDLLVAVPKDLGDEALELCLPGGRESRVGWSEIQALAVAEVEGLGAEPVTVIDCVLNWRRREAEPLRVVRMRLDSFEPKSLIEETGEDPLESFLAELLERTHAVPLPDPESALGLRRVRFESLEAYENSVLRGG